LAPLPALSALRRHVAFDGVCLVVQVPAWHWAWRGIVLALALPPLFALLAALLLMEDAEATLPSVVIGGLAAVAFLSGLLVVLASPLLSARSKTRIDFSRGAITSTRFPELPLHEIASLAVVRPSPWTAFLELRALRRSGGPIRILGPLVPKQSGDLYLLASWLGTSLNVAVDASTVEPRPGASSSGDHMAGLLCYLPVQGIFLIASLYFLFAGKKRPFVRFCAIQSLSQFVFSFGALVVLLVALGVPVAALDGAPLQTVFIVLLALGLTAFWLWNFGAHAYACYAAYKGRLWVMPWLGFWVRRFLPEQS